MTRPRFPANPNTVKRLRRKARNFHHCGLLNIVATVTAAGAGTQRLTWPGYVAAIVIFSMTGFWMLVEAGRVRQMAEYAALDLIPWERDNNPAGCWKAEHHVPIPHAGQHYGQAWCQCGKVITMGPRSPQRGETNSDHEN